jgi:Histidinol-phosphate/aromatic aminotransferase and cobyric acid decarboxylase
VVDAIAEAARSVHRYPDNGAQALIGAIADKFGVPAHVAVGCGSVGVTQQLLEAIGEPGAEVMYAWRSFEAYPILATWPPRTRSGSRCATKPTTWPRWRPRSPRAPG